MATKVLFDGSSNFLGLTGETPFALYNDDSQFQEDINTTTIWCAKRLGYPIVDIEMQTNQF